MEMRNYRDSEHSNCGCKRPAGMRANAIRQSGGEVLPANGVVLLLRERQAEVRRAHDEHEAD